MIDKTIKQLIFVFETSEEDKSDSIYVNAFLDKYFELDSNIINNIFLKGKQNYNNKVVKRRINNLKKMALSTQNIVTEVIYFIDLDSCGDINKDKGTYLGNLIEYIAANGYELVWFCKDIEEVFLNKTVNKKDNKTALAKDFVKTSGIEKLSLNRFSHNKFERYYSNIYNVLSAYLRTK